MTADTDAALWEQVAALHAQWQSLALTLFGADQGGPNQYFRGKSMAYQDCATSLAEILPALAESYRKVCEDNAHALTEAKKRQPDYPWQLNTASEAVWCLGESLRGVELANNDLHAKLVEVCAERDAARNSALDEAAEIARTHHAFCDCPNGGKCEVAAAIRSLKAT